MRDSQITQPLWDTNDTDADSGDRDRIAVSVTDQRGTIAWTNQTFADLFIGADQQVDDATIHQLLDIRTESVTTRELFAQLRTDGSLSRELGVETATGDDRTIHWEAVLPGQTGNGNVFSVYVDNTDSGRTAAKARLGWEVNHCLAAAETYFDGLKTVVAAICTYTDWVYGEVWTPVDDGDYLEYTLGHTDESSIDGFLTASQSMAVESGKGIPGRVSDTRSAEWVPDITAESVDAFHREELATAAGLQAAFAVPVVADERVVSVLVFFLRDPKAIDRRLATDVADVVATLGSVIERKQLETQRRKQNEQLDQFTSTVAHDLRNPLGVAQGYMEVLEANGPHEASSQEALSKVSNSLDRMEELIDNLLTLSRSGDTIGEQTWLSLEAVAAAAWDNVRTDTATVDIEEGRLRGDKVRLQQLFENLFRNSVEHGSTSNRTQSGDSVEHGSTSSRPAADDSIEQGSTDSQKPPDETAEDSSTAVTVRVGPLEPIRSATRTEDEPFATGFYVEDDGPGIPADQRESVFAEEYSTSGTGIGLQTVEEIATAHGWDVTCTEGKDGGARFEFTESDSSRTHESVRWSHISEPPDDA